jgi:hypothetical protein
MITLPEFMHDKARPWYESKFFMRVVFPLAIAAFALSMLLLLKHLGMINP